MGPNSIDFIFYMQNIFLLLSYPDINLIPNVQQHDIILIQIILVKVCNLCCYKATRLIGALK